MSPQTKTNSRSMQLKLHTFGGLSMPVIIIDDVIFGKFKNELIYEAKVLEEEVENLKKVPPNIAQQQ